MLKPCPAPGANVPETAPPKKKSIPLTITDIERAERLIVKLYKDDAPKAHKEKLMQSHRVRQLLDLAQERAQRLVTIYDDADGARREEIAALRGDDVFG